MLNFSTMNWHEIIDQRNYEMDQVIAEILREDPTKLNLVVAWIEKFLADPDYSAHSKDVLTEWLNLINNEHMTPFSNEWGEPLFGATFFGITGLHMTHVVIGVIYLGVICFAVARGKFKYEDVEVAGLYWHFVDLVWMFVFPLVYLMSAKI